MSEILWFLSLGGLESWLNETEPAWVNTLSYEDFSRLRPKYASSSWRSTLGKLVERRLVLKTTRDGRVAFQITRQGGRELRSLYPVFSGLSQGEWYLLLLRPIPGKIRHLSEAKKAAVQAGYFFIHPLTAIRSKAEYSDYLTKTLLQSGYQAVFLPVSPGKSQPIPLSEFVSDHDRTTGKSREWGKISKDIDSLLMELSGKKTLKNQTKERIGSVLISGLSYFSQLDWLDLESPQQKDQIFQLARLLDTLMQAYAGINYAWRAQKDSGM